MVIPVAPTTTGQKVASTKMTSSEMARQVAIAQGIIDPVSGAVLGRFEVHPPSCSCNDCQWFNSREVADAFEF